MIEYSGTELPDAGLTLRIDVFNVLNSQRPVSYVKENVPIFGAVWGRQQPRQARVVSRIPVLIPYLNTQSLNYSPPSELSD